MVLKAQLDTVTEIFDDLKADYGQTVEMQQGSKPYF